MRLRVRIAEGAARGLCGSCRYGWAVKNDRGVVQMRCSWQAGEVIRVLRPIVECSEYSASGRQDKYEMEKIAWVIDADSIRKGKPGFITPPKKEE